MLSHPSLPMCSAAFQIIWCAIQQLAAAPWILASSLQLPQELPLLLRSPLCLPFPLIQFPLMLPFSLWFPCICIMLQTVLHGTAGLRI